MSEIGVTFEVVEDNSIRRHEIPHRLTDALRRLMKYFAKNRTLITCVGNIGAGKSSLVKFLAYNTGMNALFELPDEGFEDHLLHNESIFPLLATAKDSAKRTLGRYYTAINNFIECQLVEAANGPAWTVAKKNLEVSALDIQHAYLDLRKMQLQAVPNLNSSTCIDGSYLADRFAFCEVLHRDMDVPYLTKESLDVIDRRLDVEFKLLTQPDLMILLHAPLDYLIQNIRERERKEEKVNRSRGDEEIPQGLLRLVRTLHERYASFTDILRQTGWYSGPLLKIDVSKIDFVSNVRHLIAVFEGIEKLLVPEGFKA